ncbi:MAG: DUF2997 domain-containing protein [Synechococcaceae cyanobacterium]|nr:DUF2997 domain-containing protein [Synechococcaceae cyanobacterium]
MPQRIIRFRIRPDGRVEEHVEGVQGFGCEQLSERIESRVGVVQQRSATAEAFVPAAQAQERQTPLPLHLS